MTAPLTLGLAGLGTVGVGLLELLEAQRSRLRQTLGRDINVVAVSARDKAKDRGVSLDGMQWFDNAVDLANCADIDVFVELIGGDEGIARQSVEAALLAGKHVVTANKALLAKHGTALAQLAEKNGVSLNYEAAVAGGIPVIKAMREGLAGNSISRVYGILNGTCNYIMTKMQEEGAPFAEILSDAQAKGYAEADPTFDIGGFDTAHKLALLTSLAFGTEVAFDQVHVEGIEAITEADIEAASALGYRIKLLGVAQMTSGGVEARVHPAMVPKNSAVGEVSGVTNCVAIDAQPVGNLLLVGPGAGGGPTASAVASDVADIARGLSVLPFGVPAEALQPHQPAGLNAHHGAYYVRLSVYDQPGAMAAIAKRMGDEGVSLESIVQRREKNDLPGIAAIKATDKPTQVTLITHETTEHAMRAALDGIEADGKVSERPQMIRIEPL
ncbi:MAG: homoserine dehydrogenase [Hyphomicrobiaceae bacterium]